VGDVRIERAGNQRWLVVDRPADKLWVPVKDFWQENGFLLQLDQEKLGIMETDWAENRAKLPQDFIRNTIGKVFENLYSTGERDKFRTRLERNAKGGTEIYITHRGMQEVYTSNSKDQTIWQPRPVDPELENEFLRRMMLKLGANEAQAQAAIASAPAAQTTTPRVATVNNQSVVQIDEGFDRAWRRVGLRWTAPASRWKTATAPRASTSCVMWLRPRRPKSPVSSAACLAAPPPKPPPSNTAWWCAAAATTAPPSRCWTPRASPTLRPTHSASCSCWPMT
jgi:hypothetical protein